MDIGVEISLYPLKSDFVPAIRAFIARLNGDPRLKVGTNSLRELDYGVAAICGGMCSCATCHVYVDPEWQPRLPAMMSDERELLSELAHYRENSRLSCQVEFTPELAGLRVRIAPDE